jgi:hypothetical protein
VPSLDGRRFTPVAVGGDGEVGDGTVFEYHQDGDLVWARYSGGRIRLGYLVGIRAGDELLFRYTQVSVDGETAAGRCETRLTDDGDGRIVLDERWAWESREGTGTSRLVESAADGQPAGGQSRLVGVKPPVQSA